MKTNNVAKFIIAIGVSQLAGIIGSLFTYPSLPAWYATLEKPLLTPPNWVFAPVWVTLYFIIGVAAYLVWRVDGIKFFMFKFRNKKVEKAMELFFLQLALNVVWSFLFFGLQQPLLAFIEILILWVAILITMMKFHNVSKTASYLMLPYLLWVCFAANLNLMFWVLNM